MFNRIRKSLFILILTFIGLFAFLQHSHAQVYDKSFEEYLKLKGISGLSNIDKEIYCGTQETKCTRGKQICLKCTIEETGLFVATRKKELGKCVNYQGDKDPPSNKIRELAGNWCIDIKTTDSLGGKVLYFATGGKFVSQLSYQKNGFLAQNSVGVAFLSVTTNPNNSAFVDKDKKTYNLVYDGDDPTLVYGKETKARGCEVLPIKLYKMKKCFFCPLTAVVFETANQITALSFASFAKSFIILIAIGFALWLAYTSLQLVFTYTKQDASKNITAILQQAGKFLIAFTLLSYPDDLFSLFISPILEAAIDMADGVKAFKEVKNEQYTPSVLMSADFFNSGGLYEKIEKFLADTQHQLATLQAIGSSLFCISGRVMMGFLTDSTALASGIKMMVLGIILFIFALLLSISFAFYFVDALLQLTIFGAMLPIMIAGWPWPQLKSYATTGLKMILNVFFVIFLTSLVVSVVILLIDSALDEMGKDKLTTSSSGTGIDGLFNAIDKQNINDLIALTDISGGGFLLFIFASIFGFKFIKEINKIAQKLSGGAGLEIAPKVATMGASTAKGIASKVTSPIRRHASEKFHARGGIGGVIGRTLQAPAKFAKKLGLGDSKIAKKVQSSTQKFAQNARTKAANLGNKKGISGFFGRIASRHLNKAANAAENVGKKGLLGAIGERLERFSIKVGLAHIEAERARRERESWLNSHEGKTRDDYNKHKAETSRRGE